MERTPHPTRKVYISNLQLVSLLVTNWKDFIIPNKVCKDHPNWLFLKPMPLHLL